MDSVRNRRRLLSFMVINPHRKPRRKLPYVELRGRRSLPATVFADVARNGKPACRRRFRRDHARLGNRPTAHRGGAETRWGANRTGSVGALA